MKFVAYEVNCHSFVYDAKIHSFICFTSALADGEINGAHVEGVISDTCMHFTLNATNVGRLS